MNPGKMSKVAKVEERLVVGGSGLGRHEWPGVAAGLKLYIARWIIKNPM